MENGDSLLQTEIKKNDNIDEKLSNEKLETVNNQNKNIEKNKNKTKKKKKKKNFWIWPLKIFIVALLLSFTFSFLSEIIFSVTGLVISIIVILVLLTIGVFCDMIGVAVTAAKIEPYSAMRAKKVKGSKEAMFLVKNAEKISSICNDVIGDICGILTGAAGAVIASKIIMDGCGEIKRIIIVSSISALIAGLTIFGKASCKKIAMDNSTKIISMVGKILSIFSFKKDDKKNTGKSEKKNDKKA